MRYWLHPGFERVSLQRALQAYRSHGVRTGSTPQDASPDMSASTTHVRGLPLLAGHGSLDEPLAWRAGRPLSRRRFLQDVHRLAPLLPQGGPMLPMTADRYQFALGLGAAVARGQAALMPPNHTPDMVPPCACSPRPTCWPTRGSRSWRCPPWPIPPPAAPARGGAHAAVAAAHEVAQVLTSGSTGEPMPHGKRWGQLVANIRAEAQRIAETLGRPDLRGVTVVGTVPPTTCTASNPRC